MKAFKPLARYSRGFTLIELMVALVLGLLMIGAVTIVFISNQQTAIAKQELDRAQEAFRFASHTITRVVQQGEIRTLAAIRTIDAGILATGLTGDATILATDSLGGVPSVVPDNQVIVVVVSPGPPALGADGHRDCLGNPVVPAVDIDSYNVFFVANGRLECRVVVDKVSTAGLANVIHGPVTLVSDIRTADTQFRLFHDGTNANIPRSVIVQMAMQSEGEAIGPTAVFSAAMRCAVHELC